MTCYEELAHAGKKFDYDYSLYYLNSKLNIKKFINHVDIIAQYLKDMGIKKGDVFTIYMPNTPQAFIFFYAINKIGAISNIVHPLTPFTHLENLLEKANSKGIIVLDILIDKELKALKKLKQHIILAKNSNYLNGLLFPIFKAFEFLKCKNIRRNRNKGITLYSNILKTYSKKTHLVKTTTNNDVATYIHSGGTSGETKTIMLSNYAILSLTKQLSKLNIKEGKQYTPIVLPIFHAYGLVIGVHTLLVQGYNGIIFPKFNAKKVNKVLRKYNSSTVVSVPLMINKLMREKNFYGKHLKYLKQVYCGGDTVTNNLQTEFNRAVENYGGKAKLLPGYGLTEVASVVTVNTKASYRFGSVGKPIPDTKIEIWDENNKTMRVGKVGEIAISGTTLMNGYLNGKDSGITMRDDERWIKTGDLGYFDKDGFLFVQGRKKRLIKIASYNIFPSEIENVVLKLPFVNEACAIEKLKDDKPIVKLVLSKKLEFEGLSNKKAIDQILKHCKKNLIKYSIPHEIEIINELPHTAMSKIDFVKIEKMYSNK